MTTKSSDFAFQPKVWSDHIMAYFDKKLVYGAFAIQNDELQAEGSGLTVNFPYYKAIGAAEEPGESDSLTPDTLSDDSFNASVFEVGKAVAVKKKAFKASADKVANIVSEIQQQIARVMAEKVDDKLNTEITTSSNYALGFQAGATADKMNIATLLKAKVVAFGDKHDDAQVCFMHSLAWLDLMSDTTAGFLKADANDPFNGVKGFMGRILNMALIVVDSCKKNVSGSQIGGKDNYLTHFHKIGSFGIMHKQEMELDEDKDILAREYLYTGNQWYAVKSFHAKVSADDKKCGALITTIS
jgi:exosome complex RNA-binding protein Csl4